MKSQVGFSEDWGNQSIQGKTSRSRVENQQTQPTHDVKSGSLTWATMVGDECSHHRDKEEIALFTVRFPPLHYNII